MSRSRRRAFTILEVAVVAANAPVQMGLALPALARLRDSAARARCQDHLRNQGLAVLTYESVHGHLPPGAVQGPFPPDVPAGVSHGLYPSLLPHLGEGALAAAYRWDVGYDHPANQAVTAAPIAVLRCPLSDVGPGDGGPAVSDYGPVEVNAFLIDLGLIAPGAKCEGALPVNVRPRLDDITDGAAYTLLVVEAPGMNPWASPSTYVAVRTLLPGPDGGHRGAVNVCTADGAVHALKAGTDLRTVAALATRAGGEVISLDW
jgi:hypothetical protein